MGNRPDGKRDQRCFTFRTIKEARAERSKIIADRAQGVLVKRDKITVGEAIDGWLAGKRNLRPSSQRSYADSLELAKSRLGDIPLQKLTRARLDALITELQESGRRVGNVKRQGLSPRSINLMLSLLGSVLDSAVQDGLLARKVAKMVERPRQTKKETKTWNAREVRTFLEAVTNDRLNPAWRSSFYGLRRGEVLGLCWSDIDLDAKTLTIRRALLDVAGEVMEVPPKTERSGRALPLDDALVAALRSLRTQQARERLEPGRRTRGAVGALPGGMWTAQVITSWWTR